MATILKQLQRFYALTKSIDILRWKEFVQNVVNIGLSVWSLSRSHAHSHKWSCFSLSLSQRLSLTLLAHEQVLIWKVRGFFEIIKRWNRIESGLLNCYSPLFTFNLNSYQDWSPFPIPLISFLFHRQNESFFTSQELGPIPRLFSKILSLSGNAIWLAFRCIFKPNPNNNKT